MPLWIFTAKSKSPEEVDRSTSVKSKSPEQVDTSVDLESDSSLSQTEMLKMGKFNHSENDAAARWSDKFVAPLTVSFGHLFNK